MRDEDEAQLQPLLDVEQQVEDLAADRHVERRRRLVGDDDPRVERQRPGDADALPLAAREGVRIALHGDRIEADEFEQSADLSSSAAPRACPLTYERIADDLLHRHARIERGERILEHQAHVAVEAPCSSRLPERGDIDRLPVAVA